VKVREEKGNKEQQRKEEAQATLTRKQEGGQPQEANQQPEKQRAP
jgi:hypothetical protein